jgi:protocatechuate 4,5-dioxygenase alpha chain
MAQAGLTSIPDTTILDLRKSAQGYRLNKLCGSLCDPKNREAFKADETTGMGRIAFED